MSDLVGRRRLRAMRSAAMASGASSSWLMAQPTTRRENKSSNQIQPTLTREHTSGIGGPDLIEPLHGETSKAVRGNGSAVAAISGSGSILGALPSEPRMLSGLAHEPRDAVASSWATQGMSDSWAAVGLATADKLFSDMLT